MNFNLTSIPLIGGLIQRGENALASGVQGIKERVADFHLVPRRIANYRARADQLSRMPVVTTNTDDVATILAARTRIASLGTNYDSVNRQVDLAMQEATKIQQGQVSLAAAGQVASAVAGMNDVMSSAQSIESTLAGIERRVLSPQQLASVGSLGIAPLVSTAGMASTGFMTLALGGGLLWLATRRRGRR